MIVSISESLSQAEKQGLNIRPPKRPELFYDFGGPLPGLAIISNLPAEKGEDPRPSWIPVSVHPGEWHGHHFYSRIRTYDYDGGFDQFEQTFLDRQYVADCDKEKVKAVWIEDILAYHLPATLEPKDNTVCMVEQRLFVEPMIVTIFDGRCYGIRDEEQNQDEVLAMSRMLSDGVVFRTIAMFDELDKAEWVGE
ncbi:hypothetical protein N9204_00320 [bacterium]|nr:hypothetical protein [bacterium]